MEYYGDAAPTGLAQPPPPRRHGRKWLLIGGLALAFMLTLVAGALLNSIIGTTLAANAAAGSATNAQTLTIASGGDNNAQAASFTSGSSNAQTFAAGPGAQGQCEALTVSSVNGNTIVGKTSSGSTVTIHTTASTQYTQAGKTVAASVITVGTRIHVIGTHNSDGSITATSIDIG